MANSRYGGISSQGREGLPEALQKQESPQREFDDARDPFLKLQREAMEKTESQRRGEQGQGSLMVKMDKPFPQLKPRNDNRVIRESFNERWDAEIERAQREHPTAQKQARTLDAFDAIDKSHAEREALEKNSRVLPSRGLER